MILLLPKQKLIIAESLFCNKVMIICAGSFELFAKIDQSA